MVLFTSSLLSVSSPTGPVTLHPAKTLTSSALILRTPRLILRHCLPWPLSPSSLSLSTTKPISRITFTCALDSSTQKHVYPDPSPEFAESETQKFKVKLLHKLLEVEDEFSDDIDAVVDVCAQVFNEFLRKDYGGPGTLLVEPFTDMLVTLKKKKLPGAALAARASLLWAQNHVDGDWEVWNSNLK